jgi:hypothetical protein
MASAKKAPSPGKKVLKLDKSCYYIILICIVDNFWGVTSKTKDVNLVNAG